MRTRERILLQLIIDLIFLNLSAVIVAVASAKGIPALFVYEGKVFLLMNLAWVFSYIIFIDDLSYFKSKIKYMIGKMARTFLFFMAALFSGILLKRFNHFSNQLLFGTIALFFAVKLLVNFWIFFFSSVRNKPNMRAAIIVGNNPIGIELYHYFLRNSYLALEPIGILDIEQTKIPNHYLLGTIDDFQETYDKQLFQDVLIALPLTEKAHIKKIIDLAERNGVRPHIVPNYLGVIDKTFQVQTLGNVSFLSYRNLPLDRYPNRFWKRAFDILFASIALLLISPFLVLIAIMIKLDSKGPVFYKPIRLGVNSLPFSLFKFRTMKYSIDNGGDDSSTVEKDARITRVGRFLRKLNLDELPQLMNVLKNEMSIVGPRPHRVSLNQSLQHKIKAYRVRHLVKPGITGWAQVNGYRGPLDSKIQYTGRTLHDLWYLEHWNFWFDLYIILLTVFSKKAYKNAF
ncbi:MAG TPA: exopolysaccharide biosynthesis polyprenyl glycosylphosphotransferase [Puia sp.]|nr:exopolysaccharide biosynthesis polyprenyl glycosylphosphotransferase [Puia sp.]